MPFTQLGLPAPILRGVRAAGYTRPTPIQEQAIPIVLSGRDLIGAAHTGTGKTAAFLLPILSRLTEGTPALRALVLVPTRELAAQVEACAREYGRFTGIRAGVVIGGVPIGPQERMLRHEGLDLLIATPGRLLDLHGRQSVSFEDVDTVVLDEADRMVDMGFAPDLRRILRLLRSDRQTLMFSATMPSELNQVAREALVRPLRLDLAEPSEPAPAVAHAFFPVTQHLKVDLLSHILGLSSARKAIVFVRSKRGTDRLARRLRGLGHEIQALHGDRSQSQRERALRDFRCGRAAVLVATDIASRGIDVDDVTHVINYDVPNAPEDYVHRIGRTGRMHASGEAITLVSAEERERVVAIERFLGRPVERVTLPGFDYRGQARETPEGKPGRSHASSRRAARESAPADRGTGPGASASAAVHGRKRRINPGGRRGRRRM